MTHAQFIFHSAGEPDTERLGRALADALAEGGVVGLSGPLGAGKTRLVQAIAVALGVQRGEVVSPTFVLVHEYQGRVPIYHIDAYRLRDTDEFMQLGVDEYFDPPNVVLVEWAERVVDCLPEERIDITISVLAGDVRQIEIVGHRAAAARQVEQLRSDFARESV
jgi:tRNA threonylcarbamoyladenosine biosynthesis protein TsaE